MGNIYDGNEEDGVEADGGKRSSVKSGSNGDDEIAACGRFMADGWVSEILLSPAISARTVCVKWRWSTGGVYDARIESRGQIMAGYSIWDNAKKLRRPWKLPTGDEKDLYLQLNQKRTTNQPTNSN